MRVHGCSILLILLAATTLVSFVPGQVRAQGSIANGESASGLIFPAGDIDTWTFAAKAGDAVVVRVGDGDPASDLAPRVTLFAPGGEQLATAWDYTGAEVEVKAPSTGTYSITIKDALNSTTVTGAYRLNIAISGSPVVVSSGDQGGPLVNGAVHVGRIGIGDLDLWTFDATRGDAFIARVGELSADSSVAPRVRVYSPTGATLADGWGYQVSEGDATADTTGTFLVVISDHGAGGVGAYRLTLAKTGSPVVVSSGDEGGPLTNGVMHTGRIAQGDLDLWTFDASRGDAVVVRMGESVSDSTLQPMIRIYDPAGRQVANTWGYSASEAAMNADTTGRFLVVVGDGPSVPADGLVGIGTYRLTLAKTGSPVVVSPGDEGGVFTNGATITGRIALGDLDVWAFDAAHGDAIVVRMGETAADSSLQPSVRIYSPSGALLGNKWSYVVTDLAVNADSTGTYLLVLGDTGGGVGSYRATLARSGAVPTVSPGDEGGPLHSMLTPGQVDPADLDVWTISATAGAPILLTMEDTTPGGGALTPWLRIYAPSGGLLQSKSGSLNAQLTLTAPVTGTYMILAGDGSSGLVSSGPYRISPGTTVDVPQPREDELVLALAPPAPNPFANRATLHFSTPVAGRASLRVYDLQGRLVRTLVDVATLPAGVHDAAWDGHDAEGTRLRPGMYLARLETCGAVLTRKLMMER